MQKTKSKIEVEVTFKSGDGLSVVETLSYPIMPIYCRAVYYPVEIYARKSFNDEVPYPSSIMKRYYELQGIYQIAEFLYKATYQEISNNET